MRSHWKKNQSSRPASDERHVRQVFTVRNQTDPARYVVHTKELSQRVRKDAQTVPEWILITSSRLPQYIIYIYYKRIPCTLYMYLYSFLRMTTIVPSSHCWKNNYLFYYETTISISRLYCLIRHRRILHLIAVRLYYFFFFLVLLYYYYYYYYCFIFTFLCK